MGVLLPATILLSLLSGAQLATKKGEKIIGSTLPRPPPSSFLCSHFPCFPSWSPCLPTQLASIIPPLLPDPQLSQALLLLLLLLLLFLNPHLSQMLFLILNIWPHSPSLLLTSLLSQTSSHLQSLKISQPNISRASRFQHFSTELNLSPPPHFSTHHLNAITFALPR